MKRFLNKNTYIIFFSILIISSLCIFSGMTTFYLTYKDDIAPNVYINDIDVGRMNMSESINFIEKSLRDAFGNEAITVNFEGKAFSIKYNDINVTMDTKATIDLAHGKGNIEVLLNNINGYFSSGKREVSPVIRFDEEALRKKISEMAILINKKPQNARMIISNGKVVEKAEIQGIELNVNNALMKIENEALKHINSNIVFKKINNFEVSVIEPQCTVEDFNGVKDIISQYSTSFGLNKDKSSLKSAATAIDGIVIPAASYTSNDIFSFKEHLQEESLLKEKSSEGYEQVASTLYAAILNTDIDLSKIKRTPHATAVDYISPGLDVSLQGSTSDFIFKNTLNHTILIITEIKGNKLTVSLIGEKKSDAVKSNIETEIIKKLEPEVIKSISDEMFPGTMRIINPGKEGLEVNVYKTYTKNGTENKKLFLYNNKYRPENIIIETGAASYWNENDQK